MLQFMMDGGFTMIPLLLAGFCLTAAAVLYAARPSERLRAVTRNLNATVLFGGLLGGAQAAHVVFKFAGAAEAAEDRATVVLVGLSEAANNLVLAFFFLALAAAVASVGAWREKRAL